MSETRLAEPRMDYKKPKTPQKDDVLFAGDPTLWHLDALLTHGSRDYPYREGYRMAGKILTEWAAENGKVDFLVFPICHSYRHYVELSLKRLILMGCCIAHREMTADEAKLQSEKHDLRQLWNAYRAIQVEAINATGERPRPDEEIEGIEAYIDQLHEVDKGSYSFRYATTTRGEATLQDVERINLARFSEHMECLCDYLSGFDMYYKDLFSNEAGVDDEMYCDYEPNGY
jgi:hypothetical protein